MNDRRRQLMWPPLLCLLMGIAAAVCGRFSLELPVAYYEWIYGNRGIGLSFARQGVDGLVWLTMTVGLVTSGLLGAVSLLGLLFRHRVTLSAYRKACLLSHAVVWVYGVAVIRATEILLVGDVLVGDQKVDAYRVFVWRWHYLWPVVLACAVTAWFYILAWRRVAINQWTGSEETEPARGDRFLENLRTHGRQPIFRRSEWSSLNAHIFVLLLLPWLLAFRAGCVNPVRLPVGLGAPDIQGKKVPMTQVKRRKTMRVIENPLAVIRLSFPDINASRTAVEVDLASRDPYVADPSRPLGLAATGLGSGKNKLGAGKPGGPGGWPDGVKNSCVRFIRLQYDGSGWNDGMDAASCADSNFLNYFHKLTTFRTAANSEANRMGLLTKYPKGYAPPFVYMTGDGGIRVSDLDVRALREYLIGGGMLFADCGSPAWHGAFQSFIRRVFPGESLIKISDDDMIFKMPFPFENGAPPIWHHGGRDAMGIKYKGRWAVFYHPGDINDAWKNNRGGLTKQSAEGAYEMGVNILYYAISNYLEATRKYRRE